MDRNPIEQAVVKFSDWLETVGYKSYDPYDLSGTGYGCWARKLYYEKGKIALPFIAPLLIAEVLVPSVRKLCVEKKRYATADGQLILAFLNLRILTGEEKWLEKARELGEELLGYSVPGYEGYCWGYPFDWQNNKGMWYKNTPFITCTPYGFEAFLGLHEATGESRYLEIAESIAAFVFEDLNEVEEGPGSSAGSYSPIDHSMVVNATAYRAWVLVEAARRFQKPEYEASAGRHIEFILRHQREDGSWLYAVGNEAEEFIDHFHTCFVLKNLQKANRWFQSDSISEAIRVGYDYYRENLFDAADDPKYFAIEPRTQVVRFELYNFAEAITLGSLLGEEIPGSLDLAGELAKRLVERYQLPAGHFVTRVYRGGIRHTFPFLRWPQAQLFYALTNLLVALKMVGEGASPALTAVDEAIANS